MLSKIKYISYVIILYLISIIFLPLQILIILIRAICGKEDIKRINERFAFENQDNNKSKIIWIHAASVGESSVALTLVKILHKIFLTHKNNINFLITSGTITSRDFINLKLSNKAEDKTSFENFVIHKFAPTDNIFIAYKFCRFWKPKIGIFIESEIWPSTVFVSSKFCPLVIANARMSDKSFTKWKKLKFIAENIANHFSIAFPQSQYDKEKFHELGFVTSQNVGNLKYITTSNKLNLKLKHLITDSKLLQDRYFLFAASTHSPEEEMIIDIFRQMKEKDYKIFLIIAPRHPIRSKEIAKILEQNHIKYLKRSDLINDSSNIIELCKDKDVLILDSIGEMNTIFSIKPITIMGGSFTIGGHNILEPANYYSPIIFGPDMSNFQEIKEEFLNKNAAIEVSNKEELQTVLEKLFSVDPDDINNYSALNKITKNAFFIIKNKQKIKEKYIEYFKNIRI